MFASSSFHWVVLLVATVSCRNNGYLQTAKTTKNNIQNKEETEFPTKRLIRVTITVWVSEWVCRVCWARERTISKHTFAVHVPTNCYNSYSHRLCVINLIFISSFFPTVKTECVEKRLLCPGVQRHRYTILTFYFGFFVSCKIEFNLIKRVLSEKRARTTAHSPKKIEFEKRSQNKSKGKRVSLRTTDSVCFRFIVIYCIVQLKLWLMLRGFVNPITDWLLIRNGEPDTAPSIYKTECRTYAVACASPKVKSEKKRRKRHFAIAPSPCTCLCLVTGTRLVFEGCSKYPQISSPSRSYCKRCVCADSLRLDWVVWNSLRVLRRYGKHFLIRFWSRVEWVRSNTHTREMNYVIGRIDR